MIQRTISLLRRGLVDRVLLLAIAARLWPMLAGPLTVILIVRYFSDQTQGLYYGFASILGLQSFFELGFSSLVISFAGHRATEMQSEHAEISHRGKRRLASLLRGMVTWYSMVATLFFVIALGIGWWTFASRASGEEWQVPWMTIVPIAALSMWLTPWIAILEGVGYREAVYRMRFYQAITGSVAAWLFIASGAGVWAVVAASIIQLLWMMGTAFGKFGEFYRDLWAIGADIEPVNWRTEIIPIQWRVAIQSAAHFLATQLLTIIVIATEGLRYGGQFGLTMAIAAAIQSVSLAWVQTKFAVLSQLAANDDRRAVDRLARTMTIVSTGVLIAGFIAFAGTLELLSIAWPEAARRFVSWQTVLVLGVGMLANHIIANQAYYVLARGRRPLFTAMIIGLTTTTLAVIAGGWIGSGLGVVTGYAFGLACVALPLHWVAFEKDRRLPMSQEIYAT